MPNPNVSRLYRVGIFKACFDTNPGVLGYPASLRGRCLLAWQYGDFTIRGSDGHKTQPIMWVSEFVHTDEILV